MLALVLSSTTAVSTIRKYPSLTQLPVPGVKVHPEIDEPTTILKELLFRDPARRPPSPPEVDRPLLWYPWGSWKESRMSRVRPSWAKIS